MGDDAGVADGAQEGACPPAAGPVPPYPGRRRRWPARVLLVGYLLLAAGLTVGPLPEQRMLDALVATVGRLAGSSGSIHERLVEMPSNVLLFIPMGLVLRWAFVRLSGMAAWALCVVASMGVEITQAVFLPGREPSLLDVAMNGLGAAIGVLLHGALARSWRPRVGAVGVARGQSVRQQ